ncbi:hypothetical protein [Thermococcus stetteri]|uniref:hypothetical protein n=1 Tax=Thermococcus stetteri TaxID=49900 RepID=UPI001AE864E7|nr:hypothetical protein [Thermococcus stetteri]MBP1912556.1 hypothetical protein [Thermococcus stetteri]
MTSILDKILDYLINSNRFNSVVTVIDRDIESMLYLDALNALKEPIEQGEYVLITAYDSLQNAIRDLRRVGIDYEDKLGETLFLFDAFGSVKKIYEPDITGVFSIPGYVDDNVFILKYKALINEIISSFPEAPKKAYVLGYNEAGMCRLFHNPIKVQKLIWSLRRDVPFEVLKLVTYRPAECPPLEEVAYLHSDFVVEGFVEGTVRRTVISKGVLP